MQTVTLDEAVTITGRPYSNIRGAVRSGRLRGVNGGQGRNWQIARTDLDFWHVTAKPARAKNGSRATAPRPDPRPREKAELTWSQELDRAIKEARRQRSVQYEHAGGLPTKTHAEELRTRRTQAEGDALLDAALAELRAGTRRRVPSWGPLPF
jgi:hypothetical protein